MVRSRLQKNIEEKSKKSLILTFLGFLSILIIGIFLGPTLLIQFSLLIGKFSGGNDEIKVEKNTGFIPPPIFDSLPQATSSGKIILSGTAPENSEVKIYNNGDLKQTVTTEKDGTFSIRNFPLLEGENTITARTYIDDNKSNTMDEITVIYISKPPSLEIESPQNNESFSGERNTVDVKGKTDKNVSVTVNGFWAVMKGEENFSYRIPLLGGDNRIKVIATDKAGNKTEKEILVTYSQ
jgi:bacillopeptidase F